MAEIVNLGSLYLNGQPIDLGVEYNGEVLSFGNTIPGKTIPFVKWGKLLVASQCVCINIICRSLKVGEKKNVSNEWDSILDDLGEDDGLWHWSDGYFWGQETSRHLTSNRAVRGWMSARYWDRNSATYRYVDVGFRPVLEPLAPEPLISDALIGSSFRIYGPDKDVCGQLVNFSDYDLVVHPAPQQILCSGYKWASAIGSHIIIDRSAIVWSEKTD